MHQILTLYSASDSDFICVRQILISDELYCYVTVKKLHYYITDFLIVKVKSQTCSLKENICVIVIDTYKLYCRF